MRRVCLLVDDSPAVLSLTNVMVEMILKRSLSADEFASIEFCLARNVEEGRAQLNLLREQGGIRLVLITDYDLGDGNGSELIAMSEACGFDAVWQMLQSASSRTVLLGDPIVARLMLEQIEEKPVSIHAYIKRLPYFRRVWGL